MTVHVGRYATWRFSLKLHRLPPGGKGASKKRAREKFGLLWQWSFDEKTRIEHHKYAGYAWHLVRKIRILRVSSGSATVYQY